MKARFRRNAEREAERARAWYERERTGLGAHFVDALEDTMETILAAPLAWPVVLPDKQIRRTVVRRFPFVVFFVVKNDEVVVLAVAHTSRRPGYWR